MRECSSRIIIDNDTLCLFKDYVEDSEKGIYSMGKKKLTKHKTFRVLRAWAAPTSDGWHAIRTGILTSPQALVEHLRSSGAF